MLKNGFFNKINFKKLIFNNKFNFAQKIIPLKLGDLGEGTKEATVKKWFKKEGEIVKEVIFNK
jgi:hypothetical protein